MIKLLVLTLGFNIMEFLNLPQSISEMAPVHWAVLVIASLLLIILIIKIWQKLVMVLIKIVIFAVIALIVYLLVVGI